MDDALRARLAEAEEDSTWLSAEEEVLRGHLAEKARAPGADLISTLLAAPMTEAERLSTCDTVGSSTSWSGSARSLNARPEPSTRLESSLTAATRVCSTGAKSVLTGNP